MINFRVHDLGRSPIPRAIGSSCGNPPEAVAARYSRRMVILEFLTGLGSAIAGLIVVTVATVLVFAAVRAADS